MQQEKIESSQTGIQVIARAASILKVLKTNADGLRLSEIARQVDLARSTVQRIVAALQAEQFVIADGSGKRFRLGPELAALAAATQYNVAEQCRPLLVELSKATGETCDLSVLRGNQMIFLDQVPGTHRLRTVSSVGETFPLTTTANGKACLAKLPSETARTLVENEWSRLDRDGDINAFMAELSDINQSGLAFDLDHHSIGISAIGIAFADLAGDLHSISVPVPSTRFATNRDAVEAAIRKTAKDIQRLMSGQ